ncbi:MAG: ECF-type sigma factor [Deltaproteobacteria bacterium]
MAGDITRLLMAVSAKEDGASERLLAEVYDHLRRIAQRRMNAERAGHTLDATGLVHEAYLKLVQQDEVDWKNRAHFYSVAAMAMRRVLLNYAEARRAEKRGGGAVAATFDEQAFGAELRSDRILALDEALERLATMSERQAKVVEYRFYGGLTHEEIAEVLEVSVPTVRRDWRVARAWLTNALREDV